jgi:hypothetical protein
MRPDRQEFQDVFAGKRIEIPLETFMPERFS